MAAPIIAAVAKAAAQRLAKQAAKAATRKVVRSAATRAQENPRAASGVLVGLGVFFVMLLVIAGGGLFSVIGAIGGSQEAAAVVAAAQANCGGAGSGAAPSAAALADIPGNYLKAYQDAAVLVPGLDWTVLAAIGKVETDHGRLLYFANTAYYGIKGTPAISAGTGNDAGAAGPMQFGAFAGSGAGDTWSGIARELATAGHAGHSVWNFNDAIPGAALYLRDSGAPGNLHDAIFAYNHAEWYVQEVLAQAAKYRAAASTSTATIPTAVPAPVATAKPVPVPSGSATPAPDTGSCTTTIDTLNTGPLPPPSGPVAAAVIKFVESKIGDPYLWGGTGPFYDCSGLTQAAYASAGVAIPRTSETQWGAGYAVPVSALQPGDLLFFNPGEQIAGLPGHVGVYIGNGLMIDDPYTGAFVRVISYAQGFVYMGARRYVK